MPTHCRHQSSFKSQHCWATRLYTVSKKNWQRIVEKVKVAKCKCVGANNNTLNTCCATCVVRVCALQFPREREPRVFQATPTPTGNRQLLSSLHRARLTRTWSRTLLSGTHCTRAYITPPAMQALLLHDIFPDKFFFLTGCLKWCRSLFSWNTEH